MELAGETGEFEKSNDLDKELNKLYEHGKDCFYTDNHISHQQDIISKIQRGEIRIEEFINEYPCYNTAYRPYLKGKSCRMSSILINSYLILYDFLSDNGTIKANIDYRVDSLILLKLIINIKRDESNNLLMPQPEFNSLKNIIGKFKVIFKELYDYYLVNQLRFGRNVLEFINKDRKPENKYEDGSIDESVLESWEYMPCYLNRDKTYYHSKDFIQNYLNPDDLKLNNINTEYKKPSEGGYYQKYQKYKLKYLKLKNNL